MKGRMKVLVIQEWDNVKDEAGLKKYYEYVETYQPYLQKSGEGIAKRSGWSDGTGHVVSITEFESAEAFAKLWSDEEYQRRLIRFCRLVNSPSLRILRPSISEPPK